MFRLYHLLEICTATFVDINNSIYSISIDKIYGRRTITPIGIHSMPPLFLISTGTMFCKLYHTFVQN